MIVRQLLLGPMANFGYLVGDESTKRAAAIDPSFDGRPLEREAKKLGLTIDLVLATHGHPDHVQDLERLARATGAKVGAHRSSRIRKDLELEDGQRLSLGEVTLEVLHTPGHTPDGVCYLAGDALFTGDTLFVDACGRVDLPGSDVRAMHHSLFVRLRGLPDQLIVHPGHDYGHAPTARLGEQKRDNVTMQPRTPEEFAELMGP
ncbi:MAG: MBL fold metallo-hydrolase [Deltaproteobacteria bacterium]|nr:MBL fold metallo-hydrolase [Deltaproteobacteria bacterium]